MKSNLGAVKVYLKANWIIEGVQKGHYLINNKQEDAILVAYFNPKYFKNKICKNSDFKIKGYLSIMKKIIKDSNTTILLSIRLRRYG